MIFADYHTHTTYCDGKNTPREMIEEAIRRGMPAIGFSAHAYTHFDESYCMKKEDMARYVEELTELKAEYRERIRVYIGFEVDAFADTPDLPCDYLIRSAHYVKKDGRYYDVDLSLDAAKKTIAEVFSNDADAYAEAYFEALATYGCENPKIIGHFDLVTKYNEIEPIVNTASPRYIAAWQKAADALLRSGAYFEINTGAVSRGYRKTPYPSGEILTYLKDRGAKFVLSGDAHRKENLAFHFEEAARYANSFGIFKFCQDIVESSQK